MGIIGAGIIVTGVGVIVTGAGAADTGAVGIAATGNRREAPAKQNPA